MNSLAIAVEVLWRRFLGEIGTGEAVFFCFSRDEIAKELRISTPNATDPAEQINSLARECFVLEGYGVALTAKALEPCWQGFSAAIILVCQQILAVEEMAREPSGFSEHAYFPRLRSMMSPELPKISSNPFRFEEFERLWRRFAHEVRSVPGSTEATITFEFGQYTGINKARWFPLSQALFSLADLTVLCSVGSHRKLRGTPREVWGEIYRQRAHLGRRAQNLVKAGFLRDRLVEQVVTFVSRRQELAHSIAPKGADHRWSTLTISLDTSDWCSDGYECYFTGGDTGGVHFDLRRAQLVIERLLSANGFCFLAPEASGDRWTQRDVSAVLEPNQRVLMIAHPAGLQKGREDLVRVGLVAADRTYPLAGIPAVEVVPADVPQNCARLLLRSGRIDRDSGPRGNVPYEWLGGVCVDRRSNKYLVSALPKELRFGDVRVELSRVVRVNGTPMSWSSFVGTLATLQSDVNVELQFDCGRTARLSIAADRREIDDPHGYAMSADGFVSPALTRINPGDLAVVGFCAPDVRDAPYGVNEAVGVIRSLRSSRREALTVEPQRLMASRLPREVVALLSHLQGGRAELPKEE